MCKIKKYEKMALLVCTFAVSKRKGKGKKVKGNNVSVHRVNGPWILERKTDWKWTGVMRNVEANVLFRS
jgi:hypothetical protein